MENFLKPDTRRVIVVIMLFTFTFYGDVSYVYTIHIVPETISSYLFGPLKVGMQISYNSVDFLGRVLVYIIFWYIITSMVFWIYDTKIKVRLSQRVRRAIIFFSFFYLSYFIGVFVHEWSHAAFSLVYGFPFGIFLNPNPFSRSFVYGDWYPKIVGLKVDLAMSGMGILSQFIIGSIAFYFILSNKSVRKNFMKYSFCYMFSLSNLAAANLYLLFGSLFRADDVGYILSITNSSYLLFFVPAAIVLPFLIFAFKNELPNLLRLIDPKVSRKGVDRWKRIFLIIVAILIFAIGYHYYLSPFKF